MRIGYACITMGAPDIALRSTILKNATPEKLKEISGHNIAVLEKQVDYNLAHDIRLFRISSDLIPFGSYPTAHIPWPQLFAADLQRIGQKAQAGGMRLSMHPGQYTVLNSPNPDVVARAVDDLLYHNQLMDALGLGPEHKIILHVGGVYGDKTTAMQRFSQAYGRLPDAIKRRLIIENDDKMYHIEDVLQLATQLQIPVVFDNLHHEVNPPPTQLSIAQWVAKAGNTWKQADGPQKTHYSQQAPGKKAGSHSDSIAIDPFLAYIAQLPHPSIDIMLEVKDKNLSAVKCVNCTTAAPAISRLEQEWALYKYTVLEHSHTLYQEIRTLLRDKTSYPALPFYRLLEHATATPRTPGSTINAAQHVWGYFKNEVTEKEKKQFQALLHQYQANDVPPSKIKALLKRLSVKYQQPYLLSSYYFML